MSKITEIFLKKNIMGKTNIVIYYKFFIHRKHSIDARLEKQSSGI